MIHVETIETSSLGDRSYLAHDGEVAVVVDPQRDIDRVLALAARRGVRITHVARDPRAQRLRHRRPRARPADRRALSRAGRRPRSASSACRWATATRSSAGADAAAGAGHTRAHPPPPVATCWRRRRRPVAVSSPAGRCSIGTTGRTDLVGAAARPHTLAHAQHASVRRLAAELPDGAAVLPTHGFGSFCSATQTERRRLHHRRRAGVNPALRPGRATTSSTDLLAGLDAYPGLLRAHGPGQPARPRPGRPDPARRCRPAELRRADRRRGVGGRPARPHRVRRPGTWPAR